MVARILAVLAIAASASAQSQSFVYVAVPGLDCTSVSDTLPPACGTPPAVVVVDASTSAVVTRIPLSTGLAPGDMRISRDGARLYVVSSTLAFPTVVSVIDAQRNQLIDTWSLATPPYCGYWSVAVDSGDPALLYMRGDCSEARVTVLDTRTGSIVSTLLLPQRGTGRLAPSAFAGRFLITTWSSRVDTLLSDMRLSEYQAATDAQTAYLLLATTLVYSSPELMSSDSSRLYVVVRDSPADVPVSQSLFQHRTGSVLMVDPRLLASSRTYRQPFRLPLSVLEAATARRIYVADVSRSAAVGDQDPQLQVYDVDTGSLVRSVVPDPGLRAISADDRRGFGPSAGDSKTLLTWDLGSMTNVASTSLQAEARLVVATPTGASACRYRVDAPQSSWPTTGGIRRIALTTGCAWQASSSASWARLSAAGGSGNAALTLTVDDNFAATNRSATLTIAGQIVTVTQAGYSAAAPFGVFDSPADNVAGVSGSIAVTGWALDDVGVSRVRVYRAAAAGEADEVYIGDATFVEGARPDVDAIYDGFPNCSRAGWGLLVLTNMLPSGGNGTFRLIVYADDVEGHTTALGTKTFTADNQAAIDPFGAIDTPGPGARVSGTIVNFGWALTPQPRQIPIDGSTIEVLIDNVVVGHPTYNNFRADVATLFPGYANSGGAVGWFVIDTTQYANGTHTIAWTVRDSAGNISGIGSRFFTIDNP